MKIEFNEILYIQLWAKIEEISWVLVLCFVWVNWIKLICTYELMSGITSLRRANELILNQGQCQQHQVECNVGLLFSLQTRTRVLHAWTPTTTLPPFSYHFEAECTPIVRLLLRLEAEPTSNRIKFIFDLFLKGLIWVYQIWKITY